MTPEEQNIRNLITNPASRELGEAIETLNKIIATQSHQIELLQDRLAHERARLDRFTRAAIRCAEAGLGTATLTDALRYDAAEEVIRHADEIFGTGNLAKYTPGDE